MLNLIFTFIFFIKLYSSDSQGISVEYLDHIHTFLQTYNHTDFINLCEEGEVETCYEQCYTNINRHQFINTELIDKNNNLHQRDEWIRYNNILSDNYFYAGQIEYWGMKKKKPNLADGFAKFVVSSFYGNVKSLYKLYIIIETDMLNVILNTKEYQSIVQSDKMLNTISTTNFYKNFYPQSDDIKSTIAMQFLYSSSLGKYQPALITLAYKYYKGFGVVHSCEAALKYYKESSLHNVREITQRHRPNYYEKVNLAKDEYIGHKFSNDVLDIDDIIEYFKVEAQNGQISYIQQLGTRYLYGQGIPQDFNQAFYYFELGSRMNDSSCIYYLGEMYLNGWGVEKVNYILILN
jgi:TPR repeat protein